MGERIKEQPLHAGVIHANRAEATRFVIKEMHRLFDLGEFCIDHLSPVMGAAAGPAVAVALFTDDKF